MADVIDDAIRDFWRFYAVYGEHNPEHLYWDEKKDCSSNDIKLQIYHPQL